MNALKIGLLIVVAVLLLVFIVDRAREAAPLREINKSLVQLNEASQQQIQELHALRQAVEAHPAQVSSGTGSAPSVDPKLTIADPKNPTATQPAVDKDRDGNPKLGVNFLIPYDRSFFHPEWVGGTLKVFDATPKQLNPLTDNSATTQSVHALVNDSLCERPPTHPEQWSSCLAESAVISDDFKVYTFNIRKGIRWQRPAIAKRAEFKWLDTDVELTADDFKFTLDLIMNPAVDCPSLRNYYEDLDKVEVLDPQTLRISWKRKVYTSLSASLGVSPLPRHIYGRNRDGTPIPAEQLGVTFNKHWFDELRGVVGVGAYLLDDYQPDKIMRFRRNPDYWGVSFHFEAIEWILDVKQDDAQLVGFKNGQVHVDGLAPLKYKSEILDHNEPRFAAFDPANPKAGRQGQLGWERVKSMSFSYLGWNMRHAPFNDKRVRQAMSFAFPKDRIIKEVFYGLGQPVLSDVHPDSQYCNKDLKPFTFDLAKAKTLLAEAGWTDSDGDGILDKTTDGVKKSFSFTIKYIANRPEYDNTLMIFSNELRKIGIEMKPSPFEWKELMRVLEDKDFDAVVGAWQMDWDIDYFQLWHSSQVDLQGSSNHCGFANKEVDELADKLRTTFDTAERVAIAKRIQAIIAEEQPYTFFRSGEGIFCWQNQGAPAKDRYLDGISQGLDQLNPLVNRSRLFWHFRN